MSWPAWREYPAEKPPMSGSYLVAIRNGSRQASTYCKSADKFGQHQVTHWTDLPPQPR